MSKPSPIVSLVVPCFNVERYIEQCIHSIRDSHFTDFEVWMVDDASTDHTFDLLTALAQEDDRFHVLQHTSNRGLHAARGTGLQQISGSYVLMVDGDDRIHSDMIGTLVQRLLEDGSDIAICSADIVNSQGECEGPKVAFGEDTVISRKPLESFCLFELGSGVLWNKMVRSELMRRHGLEPWPRFIDSGADYIQCFGMFADAQSVSLVSTSLYEYLSHPQSMSKAPPAAEMYSILLYAYAVAHQTYQKRTDYELGLLDQLYRRQLMGTSYVVFSDEEMAPYRDQLGKAVRLLADVRPQAIAAWMNPGISNPDYGLHKKRLPAQWIEMNRRMLARVLRWK